MNSADQDLVSMHPDININKCALKLVGFEFGCFTDEELLEFISYYVPPFAIKALFYDSSNNFYVLHLSNVEHTSVLIGKTLRFGNDSISFLPLLDCFAIGNVYPSLTNSDIFEIFSEFGKVFDVANSRVLPNSSKFFHVLSGTREVSFLLPGSDSEVDIPKNVVHGPYIFRTQPLCVGCQTQGHSLLNCPDKIDDKPAPDGEEIYCFVPDSIEQETRVKIQNVKTVESLQIEKCKDDNLLEKQEESYVCQKQEDSQPRNHEHNNLLEEHKESVLVEKPEEKILSEENNTQTDSLEEKSSIAAEDTQTDSLEEKPSIAAEEEKVRETSKTKQKDRTKLGKRKRKEQAKRRKNALPDVVEINHLSNKKQILGDFPPSVKSFIGKSKGVIPAEALNELFLIDARNRGSVISFIFQFTSNIKAVVAQLLELDREFYLKRDLSCKDGFKLLKKKIFTLVNLLNKCLRNSY